MPTLLSVTEVRQHVETDLGDDALTRLVEDADLEIIDRLGALTSQVEVLDGEGLQVLPLARKASSITTVVERIEETDYALAANDYELLSDKFQLLRKQGTNYPSVSWRGRVTVTYVPYDETASRKRLLADLVRLAVEYTANKSVSIGDASKASVVYQDEREALFRALLLRNRRLPIA